jgi:hypothetical protein
MELGMKREPREVSAARGENQFVEGIEEEQERKPEQFAPTVVS